MSRVSAVAMLMVIVLGACGEAEGEAPVQGTGSQISEEDVSRCSVGDIDGDLYLYAREGMLDPELVGSFAMESEAEVVVDFYAAGADVVGKLQSGAAYDLVTTPGSAVSELSERGLIAAIQTSAVPNMEGVDPLFRNPPYDLGGGKSIAFLWGTYGLGINSEAVGSDAPRGWSLVFDPALAASHSGTIAMLDDDRQTLGVALIALGYSPNSTDVDELAEASSLLSDVNQHLSYGTSRPQELVDGSTHIAHVRSDLFLSTLGARGVTDEELPVSTEYIVPSEGAIVWTEAFVIPTTAEHTCTALSFVNYMLAPENAAASSNWTSMATTIEDARTSVDPWLLEDPAVYPSEGARGGLQILGDVGIFRDEYTRQFAVARS